MNIILQEMKQQNIGLKRLSELTGVNKLYLSNIIHGHDKPSNKKLFRIYKELNINPYTKTSVIDFKYIDLAYFKKILLYTISPKNENVTDKDVKDVIEKIKKIYYDYKVNNPNWEYKFMVVKDVLTQEKMFLKINNVITLDGAIIRNIDGFSCECKIKKLENFI